MTSLLQRFIEKITGMGELIKLLQQTRNISAYIALREILKDERYSNKKLLSRYGFKVHSQAEEDGIIHEIFQRIGTGHKTFIEIGTSDGLECNSLYLLRQGWKGAWVEGDCNCKTEILNNFNVYLSNESLIFLNEKVTRDNINQLYEKIIPSVGLDFLSIDIDGNDYHVLKEITNLNARVIVLEYNPVYAPPIEWIMKYNPEHEWIVGSDNYGASLKSYEIMMKERGYCLVGCTLNGNNAFFIKEELAEKHFHENCTAEFHYEPQRFWLNNAYITGHSYKTKT